MARGWAGWRALLRSGREAAPDAVPAAPEGVSEAQAPAVDAFTVGGGHRARRGPWAMVVAGLVALAIILTLVQLNASNNSSNSASPPVSSTTAPSSPTTIPFSVVLPTIPAQPKTAASGSSPSTTEPAGNNVVAAHPTTTTTEAPTACTRQDLTVTTTTDASNYSPGQPVTITTKITDVNACNFQPAMSSSTPCETSAFVGQQQADGSYQQVFPYTAQPESQYCKNPQAGVMNPGATQFIQYVWSGQVQQDNAGVTTYPNAPDGNYLAYGAWNWAGPSGTVQAIITAPFTISG